MISPTDPAVGVTIQLPYAYGRVAPFNPPEAFPEYAFGAETDPGNTAYTAVRDVFWNLGLDRANYGTRHWNPLGEIIRPGDRVVLKPNAVLEQNYDPTNSVFASITHPSVIRAVADYCWLALEGRGEIALADAPLMAARFDRWIQVMQLEALQAFYSRHNKRLQIIDLRETTLHWMLGFAPSAFRRKEMRDPLGYTDIDLGERSMLAELSDQQMQRAYGADYRVEDTIRAHTGGRHTYRVSNTVLASDVLVALPKLKLHKKVGVTMSIKGMVGIIGDKNTIVHHRRGAPASGGDEYPVRTGGRQAFFHDWHTALISKVASRQTMFWDAVYLANEVLRRGLETVLAPAHAQERQGGGSWIGNDTAWRMGADLLRIALYGRLGRSQIGLERRRMFVVVDGIIGGDLHGPLAPRERHAHTILAGANPVAVDWVGARLMNVNPEKLRLLTSCRADPDLAWTGSELPEIRSDRAELQDLWKSTFHLGFEMAIGWRGEAELFEVARGPILLERDQAVEASTTE